MKHLGLIVEDQSDADVLQELARKIARKNFAVRRVLGHGCGKIRAKAHAWAEQLRIRGCSLLVLACDLDDRALRELEKDLKGALRSCPIENHVVVIPVRELEAWLLADHDAISKALRLKRRLKQQANTEAMVNPKERLGRLVGERSSGAVIYLNTVHNVQIARHVTVSRLQRCASFRPFEQFLRTHLC